MQAVFGYDDVGNHATMLVDTVRMRAFAEAIRRTVKTDDVVVDVGSGSGVLALLCAKAGARRVYAVEKGPMASVIASAAEKNGVGSVVRVLRQDARDLTFDGAGEDKPTLIVSEMIGSFGLEEDYLGLLGTVRARCAPACRVLPASLSIGLALAAMPALAAEIELVRSGLGVNLDEIANLLTSRVSLAWVDAADVLSSPTPAARFLVGQPPPRVVGGEVVAARAGEAHGIVAWFEAELAEGVSLSSAPSCARTHWAHVIFPFDVPLTLAEGDRIHLEVRPRVISDRSTWSWSASYQGTRRSGDAMKSLVGSKDDLLRRLGVRVEAPDPRGSERLARWAAALSGGVDDIAVLTRRLRAAYPGRYVDDEDAAAEIERMLRIADA